LWNYFVDLILFFTLYSFMGWLLETSCVSISEGKFVNRGFLSGPFCPIYGFGTVLIIWSLTILKNIPLPAKIMLAILLTTTLEYLTGFLMEKLFKCKWWDYSKEFLNLHGRICLKFSLLWGILAYILIAVIHPLNIQYVLLLPEESKFNLAIVLILYFIFDTLNSAKNAWDLRRMVFAHCKNPAGKSYEEIAKYRRIFSAFPRLCFSSAGKFNQEIRRIGHEKFEKVELRFKKCKL